MVLLGSTIKKEHLFFRGFGCGFLLLLFCYYFAAYLNQTFLVNKFKQALFLNWTPNFHLCFDNISIWTLKVSFFHQPKYLDIYSIALCLYYGVINRIYFKTNIVNISCIWKTTSILSLHSLGPVSNFQHVFERSKW